MMTTRPHQLHKLYVLTMELDCIKYRIDYMIFYFYSEYQISKLSLFYFLTNLVSLYVQKDTRYRGKLYLNPKILDTLKKYIVIRDTIISYIIYIYIYYNTTSKCTAENYIIVIFICLTMNEMNQY